jgi:hypothetical protein
MLSASDDPRLAAFTDLKGRVSRGEALSSATHTLKPIVDANAAAHRAKSKAMSDFSG